MRDPPLLPRCGAASPGVSVHPQRRRALVQPNRGAPQYRLNKRSIPALSPALSLPPVPPRGARIGGGRVFPAPGGSRSALPLTPCRAGAAPAGAAAPPTRDRQAGLGLGVPGWGVGGMEEGPQGAGRRRVCALCTNTTRTPSPVKVDSSGVAPARPRDGGQGCAPAGPAYPLPNAEPQDAGPDPAVGGGRLCPAPRATLSSSGDGEAAPSTWAR